MTQLTSCKCFRSTFLERSILASVERLQITKRIRVTQYIIYPLYSHSTVGIRHTESRSERNHERVEIIHLVPE